MEIADLVAGVRERSPTNAYFADYARGLADAAFSSDPGMAADATKAMFSEVVEPWADSFNTSLCTTYALFMAEVLCARSSPVAEPLRSLGFDSAEALAERNGLLASTRPKLNHDLDKVRKVAVLSRVTLGADVAVTRPLLLAAQGAFPEAEIEFVGPAKNAELILAGESIRHLPIAYGRTALLAERLQAWSELREAVQRSVAGLTDEQYLVIDPDSRLTQLGMLPIVSDSSYLFIESRSAGGNGDGRLGALALQWFGMALGIAADRWSPAALEVPPAARESVADQSGRSLAAVSFGVGGREAKRVGESFEIGLLERLRKRGYRIVLDYGLGEEEARVVDGHLASFSGASSSLLREQRGWPGDADLLTWQGSLADFGAFTGAADVYVGYDSAAAHVAAAYGTPVVQIFAGAPNDLFRHRWTPAGTAPVRALPVSEPVDVDRLLRSADELLAEVSSGKILAWKPR